MEKEGEKATENTTPKKTKLDWTTKNEKKIFLEVGDKKEEVIFVIEDVCLADFRKKLGYGKGLKFLDQEGYPVATTNEGEYTLQTVIDGNVVRMAKESDIKVAPFNMPNAKNFTLDISKLEQAKLLEFKGQLSKLATINGGKDVLPKVSEFKKEWDYIIKQNNLLNAVIFTATGPARSCYNLFRIKDTANILANAVQKSQITTVESNSEYASTFASFGFWQVELSASMAFTGGGFGISGGYKKTEAQDFSTQGSNSFFTSMYQYPMCEIDVDPENNDWMELNPLFLNHINELVTTCSNKSNEDSIDAVREFINTWGIVFPRKVTLGGQLHHTSVQDRKSFANSTAKSEEGKFALALKGTLGSLNINAEGGKMSQNGESSKKGASSLNFEAVGGNTLLANSPSLWIPTLEHYENWAAIQVEKNIHIKDLIPNKDLKFKFETLLNKFHHTSKVSTIIVRYGIYIDNITVYTDGKNGSPDVHIYGGLGGDKRAVIQLEGILTAVECTYEYGVMRTVAFEDSFGKVYGPYGEVRGTKKVRYARPGKAIKKLSFEETDKKYAVRQFMPDKPDATDEQIKANPVLQFIVDNIILKNCNVEYEFIL